MPNADPATISLLVLDVDGCLTDGSIYLDADGRETKRFSIKDGLGIVAWQRLGMHAAIVTGRSSGSLEARARELGITRLRQGVSNKSAALGELLDELGLRPEQAAAIGDDWNDLPMLAAVGFAACPADAADAVRRSADLVCARVGGSGAVREVIEHLLAAKGRLDEARRLYHDSDLPPSDR